VAAKRFLIVESEHELFVAGCVLLLALLASIVLDDTGVSKRQEARRNIPPFGPW